MEAFSTKDYELFKNIQGGFLDAAFLYAISYNSDAVSFNLSA